MSEHCLTSPWVTALVGRLQHCRRRLKRGHDHPHEQMGLVLEGHLSLTVGEEMRVLGPGDVCAIPPNVRHGATKADDGCAVIEIFTRRRDDYR